MDYIEFKKGYFEANIYSIAKKYNLGFVKEVSEELSEENKLDTNEFVYRFKISFDLYLYIYSTVDKQTDLSRNYGNDAIRFVVKNGDFYFKEGSKKRTKGLFKGNLENHIIEVYNKYK